MVPLRRPPPKTPATPHTPSRRRGLILAAVASATWGTVPIGGKIALGGIPASALSSLRLLTAGVFLVFWLRGRIGRPSRLLCAAALALAGNYVFYMWGLQRAGAATAQVLIQTAPLFLILLGVVFLGEGMTRRQAAGTATAFLGVGLVSFSEGAANLHGILLILVAALTWAVYAALHKRLGREHASGGTMTWIFLCAGAALLPLCFFEPAPSADGVEMAAIAYLCLNTVVAYWAFAECLRHIPASLAAVILTLGPVVTFVLLIIANGMDQSRIPYEPVTAAKLAGAALVMGGVAVAVYRRNRRS